jgi:L-alanine-DL-glutamate epimerase-like enolase superfamily enzyme
MRVTAIRHQTVPVSSAISNASISFSEMTLSAVAVLTDVVRDGRRVVGYGFNSAGRYAQSSILEERVIPRLMKAPPGRLLTDDGKNFDPFEAWQIMMTNEKPGGHGERSVAVGTVDMALWDLVAKIESKPLYRLLADRYHGGVVDREVDVYAAGGYYYPGKGTTALQDEMRAYLDLGYGTLKIKIGGARLEEDLQRIEAVLKLVDRGEQLAVDANGRFDLDTALRYAEALAPYKLKWLEEPGDPLDYALNAEVCAVSATPIGTGENLFSMQDARNLIRYGGMRKDQDFLQMDPALSYGLVEYLRTLDMLEKHGWSARRCVAHGGHQMSLHIAAGLGLVGTEAYPGVFEPFGGFADEVRIEKGKARISEAPGIGVEQKANLLPLYEELARQ